MVTVINLHMNIKILKDYIMMKIKMINKYYLLFKVVKIRKIKFLLII